jgi:putative ABC transport system substrate-binding protein
VIVALSTTPAAIAAKAATNIVPIVFVIGTDPVKLGLVGSLNRPGGNLTGVSFLNRAIVAKQFEILTQAAPTVSMSGFLVNPTNPFVDLDISDAQAAASTLGRKIVVAKAATENEIDAALASLAQAGVGSLLVAGDILLNNRLEQITAVAARMACAAPRIMDSWDFSVAPRPNVTTMKRSGKPASMVRNALPPNRAGAITMSSTTSGHGRK